MTQVWESMITVALGKLGINREINAHKFSPAVHDHVYLYGLRQIVNDAMASGKTADEKVKLADQRIANLLSGTLRASPNRVGDPVMAEALSIATARVEAAIRKAAAAGKCPKLADWKSADVRKRAVALIEKDGSIMVAAALAAEAKANVDIDLDDIDLD